MACSKYTLTNTGTTSVNFNYRRCDDFMWQYQVNLDPNESKNIWLVNNSYHVAQLFQPNIQLTNDGLFPLTPTPTPSITPTNTPTPTITETPTQTPTPTPTETPTQIVYDFDVTADWNSFGVSDQTTFTNWLITQGASSVNITLFSLVGNQLQSAMSVSGTVSMDLSNKGVTLVNKIGGFVNIDYLGLSSNNLINFDPLSPLPNTLTNLDLNGNQISSFNPTLPLPTSLLDLSLANNGIVTFNPTLPLPTSLERLFLNNNQIVIFNPTLPLPTSLVTLNLSSNQIVTFNPSLTLPTSLTALNLNSNLMTTAGYFNSEPWANSQPSFTSTCTMFFVGNVNLTTGTNFRSILITKNCNVFG